MWHALQNLVEFFFLPSSHESSFEQFYDVQPSSLQARRDVEAMSGSYWCPSLDHGNQTSHQRHVEYFVAPSPRACELDKLAVVTSSDQQRKPPSMGPTKLPPILELLKYMANIMQQMYRTWESTHSVHVWVNPFSFTKTPSRISCNPCLQSLCTKPC